MASSPPALPQLILAPGTQVVSRVEVRSAAGALLCPLGAVGTVVLAPADATHSYRVRLPGGGEVALKRQELRIRKPLQQEDLRDLEATLPEHDYSSHVILRCIVGARAYGLAQDGSDGDRRGIYLPPADLHWSLLGVPEQLENRATGECCWELEKFLRMALKANPYILECLYSPLVETATGLGRELIARRAAFLSQRIYQTYKGYVLSQFNRLDQGLRATGEIDRKHCVHLLRLQLAGITALREQTVPVRVEPEHREALLAVQRGDVPWDEIGAWRRRLHAELDAAFAATALPEQPDYAWANEFLLRARRSAL
jgi:hypothetical protein